MSKENIKKTKHKSPKFKKRYEQDLSWEEKQEDKKRRNKIKRQKK